MNGLHMYESSFISHAGLYWKACMILSCGSEWQRSGFFFLYVNDVTTEICGRSGY